MEVEEQMGDKFDIFLPHLTLPFYSISFVWDWGGDVFARNAWAPPTSPSQTVRTLASIRDVKKMKEHWEEDNFASFQESV